MLCLLLSNIKRQLLVILICNLILFCTICSQRILTLSYHLIQLAFTQYVLVSYPLLYRNMKFKSLYFSSVGFTFNVSILMT
jgi:hypothetical protein